MKQRFVLLYYAFIMLIQSSALAEGISKDVNPYNETGLFTIESVEILELNKALDLVVSDCSDVVFIEVCSYVLSLDTFCGWEITVLVFDISQDTYYLRRYFVDTTGAMLFQSIPQDSEMINSTITDMLLVRRATREWECIWGNMRLWPADISAAFFEQYHVLPSHSRFTSNMPALVAPSEATISLDDAREIVYQLFYNTYHVELSNFPVYEGACCTTWGDDSVCWLLSYWIRVKIGDDVVWVEFYSALQDAKFENTFQTLLSVPYELGIHAS